MIPSKLIKKFEQSGLRILEERMNAFSLRQSSKESELSLLSRLMISSEQLPVHNAIRIMDVFQGLIQRTALLLQAIKTLLSLIQGLPLIINHVKESGISGVILRPEVPKRPGGDGQAPFNTGDQTAIHCLCLSLQDCRSAM